MQPYSSWCDLSIFYLFIYLFGDVLASWGTINRQKQYQNIFQNNFALGQINKNLEKSCFHNVMLYFLTKEKTNVYDWGAYFIEHVFECYSLSNNIFWDSRIWTSLRSKLGPGI